MVHPTGPANIVAEDAQLQTLVHDFQFTEGPAVNAQGDIFFTDLRVSRIYRVTDGDKPTVWRDKTAGTNGLYFDGKGNLVACESDNGRIVSISPAGDVTVLADTYRGKRFNKPNDLWIDPADGVYFTDPAYGRDAILHQDGEHVYYITPDRTQVLRVIDDLVKPNGLIGQPNGKVLYVADAGAGKTYRYNINPDGSLSHKTLFVPYGSDGMTIDSLGNLYLTTDAVLVFNSAGKQIDRIETDDRPTNVTFGGADRKTLFITARSTVQSIQTRVSGVRALSPAEPTLPSSVLVKGGSYQMGDHHDLGGQEHRNDEVPVHTVNIDALYVSAYETTNAQYCEFLKEERAAARIEVENGKVYGDDRLYLETRAAVPYSHIDWDGEAFRVVDSKESHPVVCVRWEGAAAFCNWLSHKQGLTSCYDLSAGTCDYAANGFRLPTEAEWEFAGRGGLHDPYMIYPWGDDPDVAKSNWPHSDDPYEAGPLPLTTPVGFYNGQLHSKEAFDWPGQQKSYQTRDGSNGYGLYDMAGNVWEWCNDWYVNPFYESSPADNPLGPAAGQPMPDGQPYQWLASTLKSSSAKYKFIFIHNLVGGLDRNGRGGSEAASLFEWGGHNPDGSNVFKERRPGWDTPIHPLLVQNKVSVVFHGHDHFYAKQDLDGIVYQLVPQPGHTKLQERAPRSASEYGYRGGLFLANSGHMCVSVTPTQATIDYIRSVLPGERTSGPQNGEVVHSYTIQTN